MKKHQTIMKIMLIFNNKLFIKTNWFNLGYLGVKN